MVESSLFETLHLDSFSPLDLALRFKCPQCSYYRKYYCYDCLIPMISNFPKVSLPCKTIILKCKKEPRCKSSAIPIKLLSPENSEIIDCLGEDNSIPEFPSNTMLLFPGSESKSLSELSNDELLGVKNLVFIDSTWHQTKSMLRNQRVANLPMFRLENHKTAFWRYQHESEYSLATIEAVYYAYVDMYNEKYSRGLEAEAYNGQYDNVLWYFVYTYKRIQSEYIEKKHKGKTFRHIPGYIKKIISNL
ncbi:hypothetical protein SteCoe_33826 [Stentor coeruleus]|uniref:tRNA-uridine aminocarboxypropyltransferase 1 n=1 Tax=Stentor coeruleus TaxID=5963 RepID=A0A1R2AVY2_9CILI|nr:hypothetical protein SteCoe_33826 [Stentor coeruleus]